MPSAARVAAAPAKLGGPLATRYGAPIASPHYRPENLQHLIGCLLTCMATECYPPLSCLEPVRLAFLPRPLSSCLGPSRLTPPIAYSVVSYVRSQLTTESSNFDRIFSQKNTPEHMARRGAALHVEQHGDPRNNLLNILGWNKPQ